MRILVLSDSHGDRFGCAAALRAEREARVIVHLGDGCHDLDEYQLLIGNRRVVQIAGNCDWNAPYPKKSVFTVEDRKILACHGDVYVVKYGLSMLEDAARGEGVAVALFGHTHCSYSGYRDGLYLFNPGSVREGSYGVVDVSSEGIICFCKEL